MSWLLRKHISTKLIEAIYHSTGTKVENSLKERLPWAIQFCETTVRSEPSEDTIHIPYSRLIQCGLNIGTTWHEKIEWGKRVMSKFDSTDWDENIDVTRLDGEGFSMRLRRQSLAVNILNEIKKYGGEFGIKSHLHDYNYFRGREIVDKSPKNQTVVVEFSSPNICKPFHAGHLRSTMLGNFIANINAAMGHKVIKINYYGDWGKQFGLLAVGFKKYGSEKLLKKDPMLHLFNIYVKIHQDLEKADAKAESDRIKKEANIVFQKMEKGDKVTLQMWQQFKNLSIEAYDKTYKRLGIVFDESHSESMYYKEARDIANRAKSMNLTTSDRDSGYLTMDLSTEDHPEFHADLLKSDNTTLYLTRDIAAALDRKKRFNFDKIHYVVENGQYLHFKTLLYSLKKLGVEWANCSSLDDMHIKFGRLEGMSTRKGDVIFLSELLDTSKEIMRETIHEKRTRLLKVTGVKEIEDLDRTADVLGMSGLFIQDLKHKRRQNYKFNLKNMLRFKGDSGTYLQYAHVRLCSLKRNCGIELDLNVNPEIIIEHDAIKIIRHFAKYDEVLQNAFSDYEPCYIVEYLFNLAHLVNQAMEILKVKNQPYERAKARLFLFHCCQLVMANGMKLIGIEPLTEM